MRIRWLYPVLGCLFVVSLALCHRHILQADDDQPADGQPAPAVEPTEQDWLQRIADRDEYVAFTRAYASCISDANLKVALKEIKQQLERVDNHTKLLAIESLLRSSDKESLEAATVLLHEVNRRAKADD